MGRSWTSQCAKTFYVDVNRGNDGFDGSRMDVMLFPQGPFSTIGMALNKASAGDSIVIVAGDYVKQGVIKPKTNSLTLLVQNWRGNDHVLVAGFELDNPDQTLILDSVRKGSAETFVTNGDDDDLTLTAGTLNVLGNLVIGKGGKIVRKDGVLMGNPPTEL